MFGMAVLQPFVSSIGGTMRLSLILGGLMALLAVIVPRSLFADPAQDEMGEANLFPVGRIAWKDGPPSLPKGAQIAVLEGDPNKEGPFVFRVKVPDGYRIPPHTHPKTERVTIISGTFKLGMGEKFDEKALQAMPAGTYGYWEADRKSTRLNSSHLGISYAVFC